MREARIIFPVHPTTDHAMRECIREITNTFGGCTLYKGLGHWKQESGKELREAILIADIAYEHLPKTDAKLYDLAWKFREDAKQVEVYLRYGNGHVQMVTERSCMDNGEFDWSGFVNQMGHDIDPDPREEIAA